MSDGPRPTYSGALMNLGASAPEVIALQNKLTQAIVATLRTHGAQDPVLVAAESARAAMLPLAQVVLDVKRAGRAEGIAAAHGEVLAVFDALALVSAELGAAVTLAAGLPDAPDVASLRTALQRTAEALAFATRASEVPPPPAPPPSIPSPDRKDR